MHTTRVFARLASRKVVQHEYRKTRPQWSLPLSIGSQNIISTIHRLNKKCLRSIFTSAGHDSTIYALSTPPGHAAIGVIRISGPQCLSIYRKICPDKPLPSARVATIRTLYEPNKVASSETILDPSALILYFAAPRTATGEDLLELHVHGGPAIVKAVLSVIPACGTAIRYAEAGEFTRRAFLNDRLDLTQVEALGDTLAATTEQQRKLAVRGANDALARRYEEWRNQLLYARGELEALIDFSEDQHFDESPAELCASVSEQVRALLTLLQIHCQNAVRGELLRHGIKISLLGAPNAGKSSLLNRIIGREAAIVSSDAGTTRDIVEVNLDLGGYLCLLGDTAGLRQPRNDATTSATLPETISQAELEGMRRAKARAAQSDVVIVVLSLESIKGVPRVRLDAEVISAATKLIRDRDNVIVVINKADRDLEVGVLDAAIEDTLSVLPGLDPARIALTSCKDAQEIARDSLDPGRIRGFLQILMTRFQAMTAALTPDGVGDPSVWHESLGASERHRLLLQETTDYLEAFLQEVSLPTSEGAQPDAEPDIVVAAEHLRSAAISLGRITGRGDAGDVEEVLGVVFEKFCVGK